MSNQENKQYSEVHLQFASLLDALSHPARLKVVEHLAGYYECPAGTISKKLPLCKSTVSQHMAKLREVGLISCNAQGACQEYKLNEEKLEEFIDMFNSFMQGISATSKNKKECCSSV